MHLTQYRIVNFVASGSTEKAMGSRSRGTGIAGVAVYLLYCIVTLCVMSITSRIILTVVWLIGRATAFEKRGKK